MPHLDGAHSHGSSGGGLGFPLAIGAGAVLLSAILPVVVAIVDAALIAVAALLGVAIVAGAALVIWRVRRPAPVPPWQPGTLQPPERAATAPQEFHLHIHNASTEDIAQALAQLPGTSARPPSWASYNRPASREEPQP